MIGPKADPIPKRDEQIAYELATLRDGETCVVCRKSEWIERDHRKNRSQGGQTTVENIQLLCHSHHLWKTEHPKEAIEKGLAVPGWADPAGYPGQRWFKTDNGHWVLSWCTYNKDGTVTSISNREALERREGRAA